jgi:hypothetical protein
MALFERVVKDFFKINQAVPYIKIDIISLSSKAWHNPALGYPGIDLMNRKEYIKSLWSVYSEVM